MGETVAIPDNQPPYRHERSNSGWWEIRITPKEVYDSVQKLKGSVDSALNQFATVNRRFDAQEKINEDHEDRIRLLEKARWPLASVTVLLATGALLVSIIGVLTRSN